jgi:hypothetical protein
MGCPSQAPVFNVAFSRFTSLISFEFVECHWTLTVSFFNLGGLLGYEFGFESTFGHLFVEFDVLFDLSLGLIVFIEVLAPLQVSVVEVRGLVPCSHFKALFFLLWTFLHGEIVLVQLVGFTLGVRQFIVVILSTGLDGRSSV